MVSRAPRRCPTEEGAGFGVGRRTETEWGGPIFNWAGEWEPENIFRGGRGGPPKKKVSSHLAHPAVERRLQFLFLGLRALQRLGGTSQGKLRGTIRCSSLPPQAPNGPVAQGLRRTFPSHLAHPAIPQGSQALKLQRTHTLHLAYPVIH